MLSVGNDCICNLATEHVQEPKPRCTFEPYELGSKSWQQTIVKEDSITITEFRTRLLIPKSGKTKIASCFRKIELTAPGSRIGAMYQTIYDLKDNHQNTRVLHTGPPRPLLHSPPHQPLPPFKSPQDWTCWLCLMQKL